MASDKRDFTDFHNFPGGISKTKDSKGWYAFPPVHSIDSMKRHRTWQIWVRLILVDDKAPARRKINWDTNIDTILPIKSKYLDSSSKSIPKNAIAQIWSVQGIDHDKNKDSDKVYKSTVSIPSYVISGKNLGKKNATNVLTQALIKARSKYLKKHQTTGNKKLLFPVAVHKYETLPKDISKHIRYPVAVQRKLDGGRAVVYYDNEKKKPVMYTRKLKEVYISDYVMDDLKILFKAVKKRYPGIYIDGELYKHGLSLQVISGMMRREKKKDTEPLEYHVFDVFFPKNNSITYIERNLILEDMFKLASSLKYIVLVETLIVDTVEEETALYHQFLAEKYEGSILRNLNAPYEFSSKREIRTYQIRKRKPRYSAEYEIVGYTEGSNGKDKGAIIWILKTKQKKSKGLKSIEFTSTPVGMDYEERYKIFKEMTPKKFAKHYKGKMMTVEYDDISNEGVPLRAKAKCVRVLD